MLEKYRQLVDAGKIRSDEAVSIKEQLLAADPSNARLTSYQVAIIDFESACQDSHIRNESPKQTVAPLVNYCEQYGEADQDNLWRLQMIIAQVFYDDEMLPEALQFAESSFKSAPVNVQPEISVAIKNIQSELSARDQDALNKQRRLDKKGKRKDRTRNAFVAHPTLYIQH